MDDFSQTYEKLLGLVDRMRSNRQQVAPELLKTRYRKSYDRLAEEIKSTGAIVFHCMVVIPFVIQEDAEIESCKATLVNMYKENDLPKKLGAALLQYCDVDLFLLYAQQMQHKLERCYYMDYWLRHTQQKGNSLYNDIISMSYDPDTGCWSNNEGEFCMLWPPTKELFEKYLEDSEKNIAKEIAERTTADKIVNCT